jgi:hypothetical protein
VNQNNIQMEAIDNRASLFELKEIYKYKDLIDANDMNVIKEVICKTDEQSDSLHQDFLKIVADEVDHSITIQKGKLIAEMLVYLELN